MRSITTTKLANNHRGAIEPLEALYLLPIPWPRRSFQIVRLHC